ncbi:MAG: sensor histidine kinase [Candidatus Limnocylindria bacterium]
MRSVLIRRVLGHVLALGGVAVVTIGALLLGQSSLGNASMLYLVVVLLSAALLGRGPAVLASFAAFLASNYFLVEPRFTLRVDDPDEWIALLLFLLAAVITSQVAASQRQRTQEAEDHARQARLLYDLAVLMADPNLAKALGAVAERIRHELGVAAVRIEVTNRDHRSLGSAGVGEPAALVALKGAGAGSAEVLGSGQLPSGEEAGRPGKWIRVSAPHPPGEPVPEWRVLRAPIRSPDGVVGEVALAARLGTELDEAATRLLGALTAQLWLAIERARLREEATAAEVLRRTDEAKSVLLDAVSHDLRTPLASIMASAGSLRQADVDWSAAERRSFAETIEEEAERLNRIVGNLLNLSRIQAGMLVPDRSWYEPALLVQETLDRLRPVTARHRVKVVLPTDELPPVLLDYSEMDQVLTNLIENAVKYSPAESEIVVSARLADSQLEVTVDDAGPGVAAAALPHLFEPFYRAGEAQRGGGSGLGLAVARGLVEAHGGRIGAENRPEGGARFWFAIPSPAAAG